MSFTFGTSKQRSDAAPSLGHEKFVSTTFTPVSFIICAPLTQSCTYSSGENPSHFVPSNEQTTSWPGFACATHSRRSFIHTSGSYDGLPNELVMESGSLYSLRTTIGRSACLSVRSPSMSAPKIFGHWFDSRTRLRTVFWIGTLNPLSSAAFTNFAFKSGPAAMPSGYANFMPGKTNPGSPTGNTTPSVNAPKGPSSQFS